MWRRLVLGCVLALSSEAAVFAQAETSDSEPAPTPLPAQDAATGAAPPPPPLEDAAPPTVLPPRAAAAAAPLPPREASPVSSRPARTGSAAVQGYPYPPALPPPPPRYEQPGEAEVEASWNPWDNPQQGGNRRHDGFALRLSFGLGGGRISGQDDPIDGSRVSFSGFTVGGSLAVGGAVTDNLILHGDYFFSTVIDAQVSGGVYDGIGDQLNFDYDGEVGMHALGAGLTYYFMPINVYLSGAVGFATAVWERGDGERATAQAGIAGQLLVGKEWWMESQWGLGVALQVMLFTAPDDFYNRARGASANLLFSATYN